MSTPAKYAVSEQNSRNRKYPEQQHPYRSAFERDRDRIIHCSAFRRLEGKTQVFMPSVNENHRTRLTHSIEVAQIGRTISRVLNLNEDLTEAVALAHDLGHSPFGHTGETVLNELMAGYGGFEHNKQSLRIVEFIERPYPDFQGLNLMYETRVSLAKHRTTYDKPKEELADIFEFKNPPLEGKVVDLADRIAYNCHDLEDGMRSRLIKDSDITDIQICRDAIKDIKAEKIDDIFIRRTRIAKKIIDYLVSDLIKTTEVNIKKNNIVSLKQVLTTDAKLVQLSNSENEKLSQLEKFLMENLYLNPEMKLAREIAASCITALFKFFKANPDKMPRYYQLFIENQGLERTVCDYIAGMTDNYSQELIKLYNLDK